MPDENTENQEVYMLIHMGGGRECPAAHVRFYERLHDAERYIQEKNGPLPEGRTLLVKGVIVDEREGE